jgi:hypothetical protein
MRKFTLSIELTDDELQTLQLYNLTGRKTLSIDSLAIFESIRLKLKQAIAESTANANMDEYLKNQEDIDAGN